MISNLIYLNNLKWLETPLISSNIFYFHPQYLLTLIIVGASPYRALRTCDVIDNKLGPNNNVIKLTNVTKSSQNAKK